MIKPLITHYSKVYMLKQTNNFYLLLYDLFYSNPHPKRNSYIPRSKRWKRCRQVGDCIVRYTSQAWQHVEDKLTTPNTCREGRIKRIRMSVNRLERQHACGYKRPKWSTTITSLLAFNAVAMQATTDLRKEHSVSFDTDSAQIGVDNRCTGCISHVASDFIGELQDSRRQIKGFGGTKTTGVKVGTLL
jgi:hypothetical protein